MQANANITREHGLATALGIINYQGKTIAVVGTDDGQVMKVSRLLKLHVLNEDLFTITVKVATFLAVKKWGQCSPIVLFTHNVKVKKIRSVAEKNPTISMQMCFICWSKT